MQKKKTIFLPLPLATCQRAPWLESQAFATPQLRSPIKQALPQLKAFTTQRAGLMLLALSLAKSRGLNPKLRGRIVQALRLLPETIAEALTQRAND